MKIAPLLRIAAVVVLTQAVVQPQLPLSFDVLIRNGRIVDGTGSPWYYGDIAIVAGRIAGVGTGTIRGAARQVIDAAGLVVAPGFIDMLGQSEFNLLVDNRAASKVLQGVTTEITGEGGSIAPLNERMIREGGVRNGKTPFREFGIVPDWRTLGEYFGRLERTRPAINVGPICWGRRYSRLRDWKGIAPKQLVGDAMEDGALGLSTSLQYVPDRFASTDEIVELAKVAARYGGIYITHQRSEADQILKSLEEVFTIAERARIPAEIFHLKTANRSNWGKMPTVLKLIDDARSRGLDITANHYPYTASSNPLEACLPPVGSRGWVRENGCPPTGSPGCASASELTCLTLMRQSGKTSTMAQAEVKAFWS